MNKNVYLSSKVISAAIGAAFLMVGCALVPVIATKCIAIGGCVSKVPALSAIIRQNRSEDKGVEGLIEELQIAYCASDEMRQVSRKQMKAALIAENVPHETAAHVVENLGEGFVMIKFTANPEMPLVSVNHENPKEPFLTNVDHAVKINRDFDTKVSI